MRTLLDRYRLDDQIAEGGFAVVYKATQLQLNRPVAVKIISKEVSPVEGERERFMLEAATLTKVAHNNIVTIHDFGETDDGDVFIVMEHLDGYSLAEVNEREGPISFARIVKIGVQIARALRQAHATGVVHGDLKPGNVMLVRGSDEADWDHVKVLDFGLVKLIEGSSELFPDIPKMTSFLGTPRFMAPEQICGEEVDGRADIYSLGCILYSLATGSPPFRAETTFEILQAHLTQTPAPLASVGFRRACPRGLESVIMRCLEKVPEHRYPTMGQVVEALKSVYATLPIEGTSDRLARFNEISDISSSGISPMPRRLAPMLRTAGAMLAIGATYLEHDLVLFLSSFLMSALVVGTISYYAMIFFE